MKVNIRPIEKFNDDTLQLINIMPGFKAYVGVQSDKPASGTKLQSFVFEGKHHDHDEAINTAREYRKYVDGLVHMLFNENKYTLAQAQKLIDDNQGGIEQMDPIKLETPEGMIRKRFVSKVVNIDDENKVVRARVSDESMDRADEIILLEAWKKNLKYYKEHPVLLSSHAYRNLTNQIGEAVKIDITEEGFFVDFKYYAGHGNPEADWGYFLAKQGMAMYSVGFMPIKTYSGDAIPEELRQRNLRRVYAEVELYEISEVLVGCNRGAVQMGIDDPSAEEKQYMMNVVKQFGERIPDFSDKGQVEPPAPVTPPAKVTPEPANKDKSSAPVKDIVSSEIFPFDLKDIDSLYEVMSIMKAGRVISDKNRKIIMATIAQLQQSIVAMNRLLELSEPKKSDDKGVNDLTDKIGDVLKGVDSARK